MDALIEEPTVRNNVGVEVCNENDDASQLSNAKR